MGFNNDYVIKLHFAFRDHNTGFRPNLNGTAALTKKKRRQRAEKRFRIVNSVGLYFIDLPLIMSALRKRS